MAITALLFLGIFIGGSILCFARHPVWGIYTYIIVFYVDAPSRWWASSLPNLRWSLLAVAITIVASVLYKSKNREPSTRPPFSSHTPHILFVLYVAWMYVQFLWSITPDHTTGVTYFTKNAVIIYLIYLLVDNRDRVIGFLAAHIIGCLFLGIVAYFSTGVGGRLDGVGGSGIDDSNNLGMYMATAAIVAGGLYFSAKNWLWLLPVAVLPFALNTLVQAGSRGAFLALVAGGLAVFLYRPPGFTVKLWGYGAVGIVLLGTLGSDFFWDRIVSIKDAAQQTEVADTSATSRIYIMKDQWRMAKDHPFGVGHKGTTELSYRYIDEKYWSVGGGRSSHNTFLSALVDQGFFGFFIWLALCWKLFQKCRGVARWAKHEGDIQLNWLAATILGVVAVVVTGGVFAPFLKAAVFVWMIPLICSLSNECIDNSLPHAVDPAIGKNIRRNAPQN